MKYVLKPALLVFFLSLAWQAYSQTPQFPIVKGFGGIYEIPDASERPDPSLEYKILVDLSTGADDNKQVSRWVDNIARMMNLHGLAGVPGDRLKVKVVVHGGAIFTLLNDENYQQRFETSNPNLKVYEALKAAGADIMVCGQSMVARNLKTADLWPGVRVAHSALTTITTYVPQGYILLKF
ncbi:DsrE family protein [Algoriphagus sp. H41]|uniref:DsrE family protein n=1 Tax=Algoriphagus oliviformis TaxID=2811231 RepID=A0ABS3C4S1_9BACT|nr:DsrE family protein [Algoriphagus oliviformis]MBN7812113.1 DsrE family protein [Algoriphagus oliviformis]